MNFEDICLSGILLNITFQAEPEENKTADDGPVVLDTDGIANPLNLTQRISLGILNILIVAIAIFANLIAFSIIYKKKYQVLYKCCLVSQGLSDILFAVFVGVDSVDRYVFDDVTWRFGWFLCGWIPYVTTLCALISSFIVTCIAFDRYQGIVMLRGKWDPNLLVSLVSMTIFWLAAAGISVPTFLMYHHRELCILDYKAFTTSFSHVCSYRREKQNNYFGTVFTIVFLPLLAAFTGLYSLIANSVYIKRKAFKKYEHSSSTDETIVESSSHHQNARKNVVVQAETKVGTRQSKESSYAEKKIRTFKIILVLMITFLVCRLPHWIVILVDCYSDADLSGSKWFVMKYLFSALSLANAAINPFIYSFLNEMISLTDNMSIGFRKRFRALFGQKFSKMYTVGD